MTVPRMAMISFLLISVPSGAQVPHPGSARAAPVWSGTSGGYHWRWTTSDLSAVRPGVPSSFSAAKYERRTNSLLKDEKEDPVDSYVECAVRPLSIVGSIASYERSYYWEGGAHPSGSIDYVSIDAARPTKRVTLTELFPDAAVLHALLNDRLVRNTLARNDVTGKPRTTKQLVNLLKGRSFGGDDNSQFGFEEDMLARFAFHHVDGDQVAVRLNVSWSTEIFRFTTTQIGFLLPIPARLRLPLQRAANRREGFLMIDASRLAGKTSTVLFTFGKRPK